MSEPLKPRIDFSGRWMNKHGVKAQQMFNETEAEPLLATLDGLSKTKVRRR